jgi:hypothetical protein
MRRLWTSVVALTFLCAGTLMAQDTVAESQAQLRRLEKLGEQVGAPLRDMPAFWPRSVSGALVGPSLRVSGASEIVVETRASSETDTTTRLTSLRLVQRVADSVSLLVAVRATIDWVAQRTGRSMDLCTLPLGNPAALFANQSVARVWTRGLLGRPTTVEWIVANGSGYMVVTTIGPIVQEDLVLCTLKLP